MKGSLGPQGQRAQARVTWAQGSSESSGSLAGVLLMMFLITVVKRLQEATLKETLFGVCGLWADTVPPGRIGKTIGWLVALSVEACAVAYVMSRTSGEGLTP